MTQSIVAAPAAEPNVTPMIDVLLVVLIVFIMAAVQVRRTIDAQLPQPCPNICDASAPIVLEVLPGPSYRINRQPVSANDLVPRLSFIFDGRPDKTIQVSGDRGVRYDVVVHAMDLARSAGARVIGVAPKGIADER